MTPSEIGNTLAIRAIGDLMWLPHRVTLAEAEAAMELARKRAPHLQFVLKNGAAGPLDPTMRLRIEVLAAEDNTLQKGAARR